jgi:hypothetical protein
MRITPEIERANQKLIETDRLRDENFKAFQHQLNRNWLIYVGLGCVFIYAWLQILNWLA